jgi:hypothetical protein
MDLFTRFAQVSSNNIVRANTLEVTQMKVSGTFQDDLWST